MRKKKSNPSVEITMSNGTVIGYRKEYDTQVTSFRAYFDIYDWFFNKTSPAFTIDFDKGLDVITRANVIRIQFLNK